MADDTVIEVAKHVGGAGAGGGLMAMLMQMLRTREAREARDALVALQGKVDRLVQDVDRLTTMRAEVTTATNSSAAAHHRLDGLEDRLAALEQGGPTPVARRPRRSRSTR